MRLRMLLQPRWLALSAVVIVFAAACYALLAPWQFRRHVERKAANDALTASFSAAPVPLDSLPAGQRGEWRLVTLTGSYLPEGEVVARLRTVQGEPAFEILTPFRQVNGQVVLVDRGFEKPVQGVRVPNYAPPPAGQVQLTARIRHDETDPQGRDAFSDASTDGRRHAYAVDSRVVARATGLPIEPGYLQLEAGAPGVLRPLPLPSVDGGPYLSYALQWIAFGSMALLAWLYFTWREIKPGGALSAPRPERPRRRSVAELVAAEEAAEEAEEAAAERRQRETQHTG